MRLAPTYVHPDAARYAAPGGAWDGPTLDGLMTLEGDRLVVDGDRVIGGAELARLVAAVAGGLRDRGVGPGDVVAWQLPNWWEAVVLCRACWRLGAIAAPLHHRAGGSELAAQLALLEPVVLLSAPDLPAAEAEGVVEARGDGGFEALLSSPPVTGDAASPEDLATVQFTSGSTGLPKAVLQSHRTLVTKARGMAAAHELGVDDVILMPSPIAHISGLLNGVLLPGATGMTTVLMDRWEPGAALGLVESEHVTFMIGPPTLFLGMMEHPSFSPQRVASLSLVSSGAMGVQPAFVERASRELGAFVKRTYGSTEAPTITTTADRTSVEQAATTDGRAVGDAEVVVVDPASGEPRPDGEVGEVWLRGPELFVGYASAEQTAAAFHDGWFRTGDLGVLRDGWLTIAGRIKDLIIRGGENIVPAEVERVLEAHPAVRQAVAVGYPDDRLGERVAAFVVAAADLTVDDCRAWFEAEGIARFKTPELVVRLDELPLLAVGKPDRAELRARAAAKVPA